MAGQKRVYKIDRVEVQDYLAVAKATKDTEMEKNILGFCQLFGVEINHDTVRDLTDKYAKVAAKMQSQKR